MSLRFIGVLHDGPVYWDMVATSRLVFTPAVALAFAGFLALLIGTNDTWIWAGGLVGMSIAAGYAALRRPDLGADLPPPLQCHRTINLNRVNASRLMRLAIATLRREHSLMPR